MKCDCTSFVLKIQLTANGLVAHGGHRLRGSVDETHAAAAYPRDGQLQERVGLHGSRDLNAVVAERVQAVWPTPAAEAGLS